MPFPSLEFAAFFVVTLSISWLVRRSRVLQKAFLLAASYYFYARWDLQLAGLLFVSSAANWGLGELIDRSEKKGVRATWLTLAIAVNLSLLGFFKYYNFFQENFGILMGQMGLSASLPILEILLPLGISFYTFQSMSYTIDLYRGYGKKAKHLFDYLVYISFFPQLLIGPICRSTDLLPQLEGPAPRKIPNLSLAVSLLASGLFKKVVLATFLQTHLVDDAFIAPENYSSLELLVAAYGYTIQVYCDFSGYTDMARGLALFLGFHIPDNFNQPYRSLSIAEFWRRWHVTFGNWLRDYIYFPLGGGRGNVFRVYLNLMITLLVAGFWHGAHWKFLIWGGIHGGALVLYKIVQDVRKARAGGKKVKRTFPWWYLFLAWAYTFHLCVFARIFFRTADLEVAGTYWMGLFQFDLFGQGIEWLIVPTILFGLGLNFFGQHIRRWFIAAHDRIPWMLRPVAWSVMAMGLLAVRPDDVAPFLYFQF